MHIYRLLGCNLYVQQINSFGIPFKKVHLKTLIVIILIKVNSKSTNKTYQLLQAPKKSQSLSESGKQLR